MALQLSLFFPVLNKFFSDSTGFEDIPVELFYGYCEDLARNNNAKFKLQFEVSPQFSFKNTLISANRANNLSSNGRTGHLGEEPGQESISEYRSDWDLPGEASFLRFGLYQRQLDRCESPLRLVCHFNLDKPVISGWRVHETINFRVQAWWKAINSAGKEIEMGTEKVLNCARKT